MATTPANDAGRTAIIAGGGLLPVEIAKGLAASGKTPFLIIVKGESSDGAALKAYPHVELDLERFGSLRSLLKTNGIGRVVMAGTIARRPRIGQLRPILPLLPALPRFIAALASGDDALLRTVIGYLEAAGVEVVGAHEVLPDLLVGEGVHTARKPTKDDRKNIDAAFAAAKAIGELDIGQAAVAIGGRTVALEGIEGTDGLLERVAALRGHGRLAGRPGGVLVKCAKPGQELRADLPGIGVNTVEAAHKAGLNGIAVEAERALGLGFGELIARADALGLFVVGLPRADQT
ncbi:MAG: LpxI family protein [Rhizobiaceae bacterium]